MMKVQVNSCLPLLVSFMLWSASQGVPIYGTVALLNEPPSSLVTMDSETCQITTIASFPQTQTLYYIFDQAAAVSGGYYYVNFLTTTQMRGPGVTLAYNLNSGQWSSFGNHAYVAMAVNPQNGNVYGTGILSGSQAGVFSVSATSQSENLLYSFYNGWGPDAIGCATIDGSGVFWNWLSNPSDIDYWAGFNTNTNSLTGLNQMFSPWPVAMGIHWDSKNGTYFGMCRTGDSTFQLCRLNPNQPNVMPVVYGPQITTFMIVQAGIFSENERLWFGQFLFSQTSDSAHLVTMSVDTGEVFSNCTVPINIGGTLLNLVPKY